MIRRIRVKNEERNKTLTFLEYREYTRTYGLPIINKPIPNEQEGVYPFGSQGFSGFYDLSQNEVNFNEELSIDGSFFYNNYRTNRILIFSFIDNNFDNILKNDVLYASNRLLRIEIDTDLRTYAIYGMLVGNSEGGLLEFECPFPFFEVVGGGSSLSKTYSKNEWQARLISSEFGFRVNNVYFGERLNFETIVQFPTPVDVEVSGVFDDISIFNHSTEKYFTIPKKIYSNVKIEGQNGFVFVDNKPYFDYIGDIPQMGGGYNFWSISTTNMVSQTSNVKWNIKNLAGGIL